MVANSRHWQKTFKIEKKISELRKKIWNPEKYFRVKKKLWNWEKAISEWRKIFQNQKKIFQNRKKCFEIQNNLSESINILYINILYFLYKKILNSMTSKSMNLPVKIYLFKVINGNTRKRRENCLKFNTQSTPDRCQWHRSYVFIVNFEHILQLLLVFLLLTLIFRKSGPYTKIHCMS